MQAQYTGILESAPAAAASSPLAIAFAPSKRKASFVALPVLFSLNLLRIAGGWKHLRCLVAEWRSAGKLEQARAGGSSSSSDGSKKGKAKAKSKAKPKQKKAAEEVLCKFACLPLICALHQTGGG